LERRSAWTGAFTSAPPSSLGLFLWMHGWSAGIVAHPPKLTQTWN